MLGTLLPDLIAKLPKMKAALLLALVKDTQVESPACMHARECAGHLLTSPQQEAGNAAQCEPRPRAYSMHRDARQ